MLHVSNIIGKLFKKSSQRELDRLKLMVDKINSYESKIKEIPSEVFPKKTNEFKAKIKDGIKIEDLIPETFAYVREAAKRTLGERHFDV